MSRKVRGLGRGLDALLGGDPEPPRGQEAAPTALSMGQLQAGRYQPRLRMDPTALAELAASIERQGVLQPILVRPLGAGRYEIIAGERRFRAAQQAGLTEVPVVVRDVADTEALAMALIENMQREDLNALEEAQGVQRLIDEFGYTHEQAAAAIGRSRSATSNLLRLLNLAEPVRQHLNAARLDAGHARALLAVDAATQILLAERVVARGLSVRETEALVAHALRNAPATAARPPAARSRDVVRLEEELADALGTAVRLQANARGKGRIVIEFGSLDQLDGLLGRLRPPA